MNDERIDMMAQLAEARRKHEGRQDERDELFQLMLGRTTTKAVERILAAGYRKPRQVTTVEEVAALPVDSVIAGRPLRLDSTVGNIFCVADPELEEQAGLYVMGVDGVQPFDFIYDDLPATVLHEGTL